MIQRIQTIFLLAAAIALGVLFALPFATSGVPADAGVFMDSEYNLYDNTVLMVLTCIGVLVAILTVFDFKNRKRQVRTSYLGILVSIATVIAAFIFFSREANPEDVAIAAGSFLPVAAIVMFALAAVYIRKDEKLVKSMDRLR